MLMLNRCVGPESKCSAILSSIYIVFHAHSFKLSKDLPTNNISEVGVPYLFSKVTMLRMLPMTPPHTVMQVRMPEIQNFHLDTLNMGTTSGAPQREVIAAVKTLIIM